MFVRGALELHSCAPRASFKCSVGMFLGCRESCVMGLKLHMPVLLAVPYGMHAVPQGISIWSIGVPNNLQDSSRLESWVCISQLLPGRCTRMTPSNHSIQPCYVELCVLHPASPCLSPLPCTMCSLDLWRVLACSAPLEGLLTSRLP